MTLHHRVDGDKEGPVVVLAGSLGSTMQMWEPQLAALTHEYRVLRYDHPGHGDSSLSPAGATIEDFAAGVLELLDAAGCERISFCGLSLGGLVGMALATSAPERVERLVLSCTAARIGTPESWTNRASTVRSKGVDAIADEVIGRWFTAGYASARGETVARYRRMLAATSAEGYARCCEVLALCDLADSLDRISVPTLVISGAEDPVVSSSDRRRLVEGIAGARSIVIPEAAHLANVEGSEGFNQALVAHLTAGVPA